MSEETKQEEPSTDETTPKSEQVAEISPPAVILPELPKQISINEYRVKSLSEIYSMLEALPVKIPAKASKSQLVFELVSFYAKEGVKVTGHGVMEQAKDNYAMLRDPERSFKTSPDDLYMNGHLIREHGILVGQRVNVSLRAPKGRDKYISVDEVLEVEGIPVSEYEKPKDFDHLTAMFPDDRIMLENTETGLSPRVLDLVAPLGKGQRGLIVAPPRGGKTILLKQIAKSIQLNHPEVELIILLLDERPEEVTDFEETVDAEVFSSTFDEPAKRHAQVSDLVMERAKRLVEMGKDVVLLLDSLTRLARGHNNSQRGGGPIGSGGLSPVALQQSRKFFGAARNCEEGGSLTILATALIETESKMDDVIFEEFKGTGNMEVRLDRELAEQRIYPAIHIPQSGTRNDDRLYHPDEMQKVLEIRRQLASMPIGEAMETLINNLSKTSNNTELLLSGLTIGRSR
ncbi:MAG: transcription termination factor Rho [Akkermansiaceae bacterium]